MQPPHAARMPAMLQVPLTLVKESVSTGAVATAFRTCLFRRAEGAAARVLRALPAKREVSAGWNALAPARRLMVATALAHFMVLLLCLGKEQSSAKAHTRLFSNRSRSGLAYVAVAEPLLHAPPSSAAALLRTAAAVAAAAAVGNHQ
eukprot:6518-Heterococcus_DN1.PRE.2